MIPSNLIDAPATFATITVKTKASGFARMKSQPGPSAVTLEGISRGLRAWLIKGGFMLYVIIASGITKVINVKELGGGDIIVNLIGRMN